MKNLSSGVVVSATRGKGRPVHKGVYRTALGVGHPWAVPSEWKSSPSRHWAYHGGAGWGWSPHPQLMRIHCQSCFLTWDPGLERPRSKQVLFAFSEGPPPFLLPLSALACCLRCNGMAFSGSLQMSSFENGRRRCWKTEKAISWEDDDLINYN